MHTVCSIVHICQELRLKKRDATDVPPKIAIVKSIKNVSTKPMRLCEVKHCTHCCEICANSWLFAMSSTSPTRNLKRAQKQNRSLAFATWLHNGYQHENVFVRLCHQIRAPMKNTLVHKLKPRQNKSTCVWVYRRRDGAARRKYYRATERF